MLPQLNIGSTCISCDHCRLVCPESAIYVVDKKYEIDHWSCTLCNICVELCPAACIKMTEADSLSDNLNFHNK